MPDQEAAPQTEKPSPAAPPPAAAAIYPYAPQPADPSFASPQPDASPAIDVQLRWLPLLLLAALGLAADFAVLPLMDVFNHSDWGAVWVYASAGVMLAQAGAVSAFLVWTRAHF